MSAAAVSHNIEDNLSTLAQTKRIRVTEFFHDYDGLRSGFVTRPMFFRCLWQTLGIKLTPEQEDYLASKYGCGSKGDINYRKFCETINQPFNPRLVSKDPSSQRVEAKEFLGTIRSVRPLDPEGEKDLFNLLQKIQRYYQYHGINLRTCFSDFDKHHVGTVTESQFYRSFPGPPDVTERDMYLLVTKYRDPENDGLVNYLNLHHDVMAISQLLDQGKGLPVIPTRNVDFAPHVITDDPTLNQVFDKIMVAVYKNGIRTTEFFRDHDPLRSGIITENQFICGLALAVGKEAQLSRGEIQKVVEFYRQSDGRVAYKDFCDIMENAFNTPHLEKKPTHTVTRPLRGALTRTLKPLTESEEQRVLFILEGMADIVKKRRLMMYPYFKDYDRGIAYTRVVTKTQFGRILHFLSLNVSSEDLKLLCRKFEDPASGDVNYPAFVQAVDQEFVGHTMEDVSTQNTNRTNVVNLERVDNRGEVSLDELMSRIRHIILTSRLRVTEYFQDYDPLRSGSITKAQFLRGLASLGLSKLGQHDLSQKQASMLCDFYSSPTQADKVLWTKFVDDVESVFTQPGLEKNPTYQVPPSEMFRVPKPGTVDWSMASAEHEGMVERAMKRLKERTCQRHILVKPVFQDFDRHNNGHVTRSQFRQCLTMLELHASEPEMIALEAKYCNDMGFDYKAFLQDLEPQTPRKLMYLERQETLRRVNQIKHLPELNPATDLEQVLLKVKTKVMKERLRPLEFMRDYDKLRSGRMLKTSFRRALDLCRFELKESEISILEDRYQAANPDYVDYLKFCDELESVFTTKDLEKAPLLNVTQFTPPVEWQMNTLPAEMQSKFTECMNRIAEKVRQRNIQLFPLFEDYDRVHMGAVSRSQFRRVLSELQLNSLVSEQEYELLWQQFDVKIGGKDDMNYIAFCDNIYKLANIEPRKP
ncbi:uncharacterized protein LOC135482031 [Liolophura sinensis]|uniref:uncharacterized protein LOC135482031 n=1 Tax=Liolophura sinensis TaxID=3198878 RepID=UPI0031580609